MPGSILLRAVGAGNIHQGMDLVVVRVKKESEGRGKLRVAKEVKF